MEEVEKFLSHLAIERDCSINTEPIGLPLQKVFKCGYFAPAKGHRRLPVVYSKSEITAILSQLRGTHRLQVELMYGTGLRKAELLSLRIKDIDFGSNNIFVRSGKCNEDRTTMLPQKLLPALQRQIEKVKQLHTQDIADGYGDIFLPNELSKKYPNAARETAWQYLFPSNKIKRDPRSGVL
ncbi:MAG: tyrosine-type recombinase/integrase, partial [Porticoccus sp.]|nr:tyrosine-type recombinase/integrase [Porticoccus sp.]